MESSDGSTNISSLESASVGSSGSVGVRSLSVNSVVSNDISESRVHKTTVASLVTISGGAVNKVLFGKADKAMLLNKVDSFNGTSGREAPARSALSLILNGGNGTVASPVPACRSGGVNGYLVQAIEGFDGNVKSTCPGGELLEGLIGKLVKTYGEAGSFGVMRHNEVEIVAEDSEAVARLEEGLVDLSVFLLPVEECFVVFNIGQGVRGSN
jgi:hypothetical protein